MRSKLTIRFSTTVLSILLTMSLPTLPGTALAQTQDADERVTFYTTYGFQENGSWTIPIRMWVHEAADFGGRIAARAARTELQRRAGLDELDDEQRARFIFRAAHFVADSESREEVEFVFDQDPQAGVYQLLGNDGRTRTDRNGLLVGSLSLTEEKALLLLQAQGSTDGWLTFSAASDNHYGIGRVRLIPPTGITVISDVDDTIKVTEIPAGEEAVLRNTFFREFRATPCMAHTFSSFNKNVSFHYVSGGPWQMYQPLADFVPSAIAGFPEGTFHMKNVRTNPFESESYRDIWKLITEGSQQVTFEQKVGQIKTLLEHFPERRFVLVGDSGEKDPEVFAEIRDMAGDQILEIYIRDVVAAAENNPQRLDGMFAISPTANSSGACETLLVSARQD